MRLKRIGMILVVLIVFSGCSDTVQVELNGPKDSKYAHKPIKNPVDNELKTFSRITTKVSLEPVWVNGDLITVCSIDDSDTILFIDTCAVYDANNNYGKIDAEVAKECKGYFAIYPYNIMDVSVGDYIDFPLDRNKGGSIDYSLIKETGVFGDVNLMTSWCDWVPENIGGIFYFTNRVSLLRVLHMSPSFAPVKLIIYRQDGNVEYEASTVHDNVVYIPISTKDEIIPHMRFYYKSRSWNTYVDIYPKDMIRVGHVYDIDVYSF